MIRQRAFLAATSILLAIAGTLLALHSLRGPVAARPAVTTLYVGPGGVAPDCFTPASRCPTIQEAVDKAAPGDVILVAAGNYTQWHARAAPPGYPYPPASGVVTQVLYITKTVTIRGGYDNTFAEPPNPDVNLTTLAGKRL